jgi:hypothetical protein
LQLKKVLEPRLRSALAWQSQTVPALGLPRPKRLPTGSECVLALVWQMVIAMGSVLGLPKPNESGSVLATPWESELVSGLVSALV